MDNEKTKLPNEENFKILMETSPYSIILFQDLVIVDLNRAALELLRVENKENLIGRSILELVEPEDVNEVKNWYSMIKEDKDGRLYQSTLAGESGNIFTESISRKITYLGRPTVMTIIINVTEKHRLEEELIKTHEKLRNIIEHSTNMFYSHGTDHVLTYLSPQSRDILGYEPEEAMINWTELITENPINRMGFESTEKAIKTGKVQLPYQLELMRKDGEMIWVEVREAPIIDNGEVKGIVGSLTDITEEKRIHSRLEKTIKFTEDLINTANVMIVTLKPDGTILGFNSFAEKLTGYKREEVMGKNWMDIFIPEDMLPEINDVFLDVLKGNHRHSTHENPIMTKMGELIHISWANTYQRDGSGRAEIILSIGVDITERKLMQRTLEESEERFRSIFEKNPLGISLANLDMKLFHPNEQFCRIMGTSRNEIVGKPFMGFIVDRSRELNEGDFRDFMDGKREELSTEVLIKSTEGPELTCEATLTKVHDGSGDPAYFIIIMKDISDQKKIQDEMKTERERAELYLDLLGHDIGNLHQGIYSGLQLAIMSDDRKIREVGLQSTELLVKRSIKLVRNVLLLSRLAFKKPELERLELTGIIRSSFENVRMMFPDKRILVRDGMGDREVHIMAEPIIEEMFLNIIHNGIKFQEGDEPILEISLEKKENLVSVAISDQGIGIKDDDKKRLFVKFSPNGKGSQMGIGLSLVNSLNERYGGRIRVKDRVEGDHTRGTVFIVDLPLA